MDGASDDETLASVLAFLDSYDAGADAVDINALGDVQRLSVSSIQQRESTRNSDKRQRLPRSAPGYTTALQRQKRAELASLRAQAQELEAAVRQLQLGQSGSLSALSSAPDGRLTGESKEAVKLERERRWRAERVNRRIKAMLHQEVELQTTILRLIRKHRRSTEADAVIGALSPDQALLDRIQCPNDPIYLSVRRRELCVSIDEIQAQLDALERDTERVLGPQPVADVVSCSMTKKVDETTGSPFVEIRTTTTTEHRSATTATQFYWWNRKGVPREVWNYADEVSADTNSYVRKSVLTLGRRWTGGGDPVYLNVQHYARKAESASQNVIVMLALIRLPVRSVFIRELFWTRVTPIDTRQVVIETCYRIYQVVQPDVQQPSSEDLDVSSFVVNALSNMTRRNKLTAQNWLLDLHFDPDRDQWDW